LYISHFGVVSKENGILDLSSPDGHSLNDSISKTPFSVRDYVTVDAFIDGI